MGKTKILIVEDELSVAKSIKNTIEDFGYQAVSIVTTGEEAIDKVKAGGVDLVLMDIVLDSEMTGTEAANHIWSKFRVPIIFLTGFFNKSFIDTSKASEPFGYLLKPYNEKELFAMIEIALSKSQMEKRNFKINSLLTTARKINQIINRENDLDKFIRAVCKNFSSSNDFRGAWIILFDELNNITSVIEEGVGEKFNKIMSSLQKVELPVWLRRTVLQNGIIETDSRVDLPFLDNDQKAISIRLETEGRVYGSLALILEQRKLDDEESLLIKSIAFDISLAIKNMDMSRKAKIIEESLVESEKRYRQLIELSPDAIIIHNNGKIVFVNEACINLCNASDTFELVNKNLSDLMVPDSLNIFSQRDGFPKPDSKDSSSRIFLHELKLKRLDDVLIDVAILSNPIVFQNEHVVQLVIRDISKQKKIEEELKDRQRQVITLLDSLPGYAFFKDINHKYIIANQKFCEALGRTKEEIIGKTDFDLLSADEAEIFHADDLKVIQTGEMLYVSRERIDKNGDTLTIDTRKVPLINETGKVNGLIGLSFDITERKTAEEAIKRYSKELEESNASKDRFFSIISHDLRSPFQGLLGLTSIVTDEFDELTVDELKEFLNNINHSAKNLFNLIENLLQWSRIQRGKIDLKPTKIELYYEVQYNINLLQPNAIAKNIQILNEVSKNIEVLSDTNAFNSVLQNLISNALKFTKPGGKIKITAEVSGNFAELTVSDTGVGIPEEIITSLFRIDTQHSTLGTEKESGTGLGLIICKELVEMQGGKIWVKSKKDEGSAFTLTFQIPKE
ncbi:MAG: hybrid sensor histidine kinase/response regulator [Ignavibacteriaceae bacterium]